MSLCIERPGVWEAAENLIRAVRLWDLPEVSIELGAVAFADIAKHPAAIQVRRARDGVCGVLLHGVSFYPR